ncbi:MAG: hypothetical protein KGI63_03685 [Xanthomonadaceae bacterium]|nr:hypothetical protein [Xanthomonadaceae bacterium]
MKPSGHPRRDLARRLSLISRAGVEQTLRGELGPQRPGGVYCVGFTGAPGAGKSTLISRVAGLRAAGGRKMAVIAVDPSSPHSAGALLGDRIRMDAALDAHDVFIRSLASGQATDGMADNLPAILAAVGASGFDEVLLETVGVGQVEYGARTLMDTAVLVLAPGAGDQIQAMKAGQLETADLLVVNKADQPGSARLAQDLRGVVEYRPRDPGAWVPRVLLVAAADAASTGALCEAIDAHAAWRGEHVDAERLAQQRLLLHARGLLQRRLAEVSAQLTPRERALPLAALYELLALRLRVP